MHACRCGGYAKTGVKEMQQINLYQHSEKKSNLTWTASWAVISGVALSMLLSIISVWQVFTLSQLNNQKNFELTNQQQLEQETKSIETRISELKKIPQVESQTQTLTDGIRAKRATLEYFKASDQDQRQGFSDYLAGLARQHKQGVWLTQIKIGEAGHQLILQGSALNAQMLPEFLGGLAQEPMYTGRSFSSFLVNRSKTDEWKIDFILSTENVAEKS